MAQNINDTITDDTLIEDDSVPLTVGKLRDALADFPDDFEVVFPVMIGDTVTDNWASIAAVLSDPASGIVGIAIR